MKLSEILSKPFKVKGGGTVNLKGLSKHIIDKEVAGGGDSINNGFVSILVNRVQRNILPHPTKFIDSSTVEIVDINDITDDKEYYFLYKKSDIGSSITDVYYSFEYIPRSKNVHITSVADGAPSSSYIIDGEEYVYITNEGPK